MKPRFTHLFFTLFLCGLHLSATAQVALNFDGNDDWVTGTNASLPQGNAPRTIEAWIKHSIGNNMTIFNYGTFAGNQKFTLHLYEGVYIIGEGNDLYTGYSVSDGNWHHLAVTHDGTTTLVYVDGVQRGTRNTAYNTTGTNFQLGANARNGYEFRYNGTMDNVRVWNIARTQQQIQDNMYASITSGTNLIASFDFEEGEANGDNTGIAEVVDGTGTANGAWNGFALTGTTSNYVSGVGSFSYDAGCPSTSVWNGTVWSNGTPDDQTNAVLNGNLTLAGLLETCDILVMSGKTLTINPSASLTVHGETGNEGTILIKADATGIGSFIDNGTITGAGSFQMEQYLTGANNAGTPNGNFHYVSSPVVGATSAVYDAAGANKLWSANESTQSYTEITDNGTTLNALQGYVARVGANGSLTFDGSSFNTGNQNATGLTRTGTSAANRGYNLVGNPYPSSVNWSSVDTTNLYGTIWYRTHNAGGVMTYDTYNAVSTVGTSNNYHGTPATGIIPPTQAVWVRVKGDGNTATVSFTNAMRSHGTLSGIYRMAAEEGTIRMTLSNGTTSDEAILLFNQEASDDFDAYDSHKFWAGNIPQLYMNETTDTVAINGSYSTTTNPVVDLGVKLPSSGNYSLNANSITIVGESVYLEDRLLNIFQDLNEAPSYAFTSAAGNIGNRFALHFGMMAVEITDATNRVSTCVYTSNGNQLNIILPENTENGNVQVLDMTGRIIRTANLNASRSTLDMDASTGVYLIRVETEKGTDTHHVILN